LIEGAGRIATERNREICGFLGNEIKEIEGVRISIYPGKEHRFVLVFRGEGLRDDLTDADPQKDGLKSKGTEAVSQEARRTPRSVNLYLKKANEVLNPFILPIRSCSEVFRRFRISPRCRTSSNFGLLPSRPTRCTGVGETGRNGDLETGETFREEAETLKKYFDRHDFFYVHFKKTIQRGRTATLNEGEGSGRN